MTSSFDNIGRISSQIMSSMDQNYAMYDGQQQKQQVEAMTASLAERLQRPLYPPLSQLLPVLSSSMVCDYRAHAQTSATDLPNVSALIEEVEETKIRAINRMDEDMKNYVKQLMEERRPLEGHATYQQLHAQLQKQQQQFQRPGTDMNVSASMAGSMPIPLPAPLSARAAGDVLYPSLPPASILASTQDALAERRAAVAAAVNASVPDRTAAAVAAAAAKKQTELQNMGLVKPGTPPPADSRSPPPTLASLASLHVEPPPPYVSNPSLAAYRSLLSQQPYSAHLANLMSNFPALGASGIPGMTSGLSGLTSTAGSVLGSLALPPSAQLPGLAGLTQPLAGLTQPLAGLQLPPMPSLTSSLAASTLPTLTAPASAAQTAAAAPWQNPTERECQNSCQSGSCHASQPMTMVPVPAVPVPMTFPMHMHPVSPFCPGAWVPTSPVIWTMGTPGCCTPPCCNHGGGGCQQPQSGTSSPVVGYPGQRPAFPLPTFPSSAMMPPGPSGYRIPAAMNPRVAIPTSVPAAQQQAPEKTKNY